MIYKIKIGVLLIFVVMSVVDIVNVDDIIKEYLESYSYYLGMMF